MRKTDSGAGCRENGRWEREGDKRRVVGTKRGDSDVVEAELTWASH